MSIFDYLRGFFSAKRRDEPDTSGLGDHYLHRDNFRNPIWQNDEDDDDDIDDFRYPRTGIHFSIFNDPLEMTRYFESQMDSMLKNFFSFGSGFSPFSGHDTFQALPFATPKNEGNLRDKMLKSELDLPFADVKPNQKVDTDLDGKITPEEFSSIWNNGNIKTIEPSEPRSFSFGRSIRKEIIRKPDGTVEEKQIIRDSEGNKETIVSRGSGDKKYVIKIKKDKNGIETKSEDLINMDENELKDFNQKWKSIKDNVNGDDSNLNRFPWEKFFGPNPKL